MVDKSRKKLFEFKDCSKLHLIALAVPLFCMATTYIQKMELNHYNEDILGCEKIHKGCKIKEFPYFFNIFISKVLSIFLVILSKYLNRDRSTDELFSVETKQMRRYHADFNNKKRKIQAIFLVIGISILELIFKIEGYLTIGKANYLELKLGFLLLVPLLSLFILKKQLFKHHYLAFGISIIAFIFVCISTSFYTNKPEPSDQIRHLFFSIPLGLAFVLIKYLYENSFIDSYSFLFYDGILCIIIPFITIGIISIFKGSEYFTDNMTGVKLLFHDKESTTLFIFVVIFSFGYYMTNALTIYLFNPSLMVMTDILSPIFRWVIEVFKDKEYDEDKFILIGFFKGVGFLIIIFSALIFNEILILRFCEFDKNIEDNITKRANYEFNENNTNCSFSIDEEENKEKNYESELSTVI